MDYTLANLKRFALTLKCENGQSLKIEPFQARSLAQHFQGTPETVIVIPEENGKTTLLAALGLFHLVAWPEIDPTVPLFASARDQAEYLFNQAGGLVERSGLAYPDGPFEVKRGYRSVRLRENRRAQMRVKASDEATADGLIPTLVLVDEYHRHRTDGAYSISRQKLGKRDGRMVTISTAGAHRNSPLGRLREVAHALPGFVRKGMYNHVHNANFAWHEWCLQDTDDPEDLRLVKRANPASFVDLDYLRRKRASPSHVPGRWLRFVCGIWTEGDQPFVSPAEWDPLRVDIGGVQDGDPVWVAVRTGQGGTGIGIASPKGEAVAVRMETLPYDFPALERALRRIEDTYHVERILVDSRQFGIGAQVLEATGLPLFDQPQSPTRLMQATASFLSLVSSGNLHHDGDPELRVQVMSGRVAESTTGAYLEPSAETTGLVALLMAVHEASRGAPEPMIVLPTGSVG